ncbi:MAG: type II toxin-antitoxin system VapC family toxin [Rhodanobacter sp.]
MVLDNSVVMRWCFGDGKPADLAYAGKVLDALAADSALVPVIWGLEVANVLSRAEHHALIDAAHSASFLTMLQKLRIVTDAAGTEHALTDTLHLARQHLLTAYDAAYLELALRERLPLATLDVGLRKAAKQAAVKLFQ